MLYFFQASYSRKSKSPGTYSPPGRITDDMTDAKKYRGCSVRLTEGVLTKGPDAYGIFGGNGFFWIFLFIVDLFTLFVSIYGWCIIYC